MQVTNRRIYIAWEDTMRPENIPLFEDADNTQDLPPPPITPALNIDYEVPPGLEEECGFSFPKWVSLGLLADTFRSFCGSPQRVGVPFLGLRRLLSHARGSRKRDIELKQDHRTGLK